MKEKIINGYAICFNKASLDKSIKNELGLLNIISSLSAEKGYCYASNKYLADLFDVPTETISRKLKILSDKEYITIEYEKKGCEIIGRKIRLTNLLIDDYQKCYSTINKNVKENNIMINNISNNIERYIEEIEQFKPVLTSSDYEIIQKIANKYSLEQVKQALAISKQNNAYSIKYLLQVLVNGIKEKSPIKSPSNVPEWLNRDIQYQPMKDTELEELQKEFEKILKN
jgi:DNA-binding MarR family transcriptional regulator